MLKYLTIATSANWPGHGGRICSALPGKILHEIRSGEMAALKEIPFGHYYGSVGATPLFVLLAGAYYERTGDQSFIASPMAPRRGRAALDRPLRRPGRGRLCGVSAAVGQWPGAPGWKDTDAAIFHADGSLVYGPIVLCEVQGYVYAAQRAGAALAAGIGRADWAADLRRQAEALREQCEQVFWCEELSTYALTLDGDKRPCRAGHPTPDSASPPALRAPSTPGGWRGRS